MQPSSRLASIDCFRSFAVLAMVLVGYLFGTQGLPAWLRHAPDGRLISSTLATAVPISDSHSYFGGAP